MRLTRLPYGAGTALTAVMVGAAVAGCGAAAAGAALPTGPAVTAFRCPARVHARAFTSHGSGLGAVLVPRGARRARLCFYAGLNPRPKRYGVLRAVRTIGAARRVAALGAMLDRLPAVRRGTGSCPGLQDGPAVVLFAYPHRPVVAVTVYVPDTCFLVTNGHRVRQADGGTVRALRRFRA